MRVGSSATVVASAYPDRSFTGTIRVIGNRVDPKTRALPVQVLVRNPLGLLRPQMFAKVSLSSGPGGAALAIPSSAIVRDGLETVVFVQEGAAYERREVRLGRVAGSYVQVLTGVRPGERIVTQGGFVLASELKKGALKGHEH